MTSIYEPAEPYDWSDVDAASPVDARNPFTAGTEEHESWARQEAEAAEQVRRDREKARFDALVAEEKMRLRARRAAEQLVADEQHQAEIDATGADASTWAPLDLSAILDGTFVPEEPSLMPRSDGRSLLYPGRVHTFQGESESGKSMIAQAEVARVLIAGGTAVYLDFESDAPVVAGRLLMMGVPPDAIRNRFHYMRPGVRPGASGDDRAAYAELLGRRYDVAVIDGVTEAASVFGVASKDNDEITAWNRAFARPLAHRTGAAVIQVDHVVKATDTRGRFAIGAQAKMSALDGAAYVVEVKEPLGRGLRGVVTLRVAKDRPGAVRPHCGDFRASDRTQEAARVVVDSTSGDHIAVTVEPPASAGTQDGGEPAAFRPTALMERVSEHLERAGDRSENQITSDVSGKTVNVRKALAALVAEGYVRQYTGRTATTKMHQLLRPYRQAADPRSDRYAPSMFEERWEESAEPPPDGPD